LHVRFYAKFQHFIPSSLTFTKLCHKRDHLVNFYISLERRENCDISTTVWQISIKFGKMIQNVSAKCTAVENFNFIFGAHVSRNCFLGLEPEPQIVCVNEMNFLTASRLTRATRWILHSLVVLVPLPTVRDYALLILTSYNSTTVRLDLRLLWDTNRKSYLASRSVPLACCSDERTSLTSCFVTYWLRQSGRGYYPHMGLVPA